MAFRVATTAFFLCLSFWTVQTKIYDRCELARELRDVHEFPEHQLATWLCIANYESHFNTSAHNPGSGDHGIFQISELFWCSPPGDGFACGLPCSALKDDDIEDDAICARRIYRQHQRMSGDGFTAWVVYNLHCKDPGHVASFLQGCFDEENLVKYGYQPIYEAMNLPTVMVPMPSVTFLPAPTISSPLPLPPSVPTTKLPPPPPRKASSPKPTISTYKPLINLSTGFTLKPFKPISSSTFRTSVKPQFSTSFKPIKLTKFSTTPIIRSTTTPTTIFNKFTTPKPRFSTYKPFLNRFPSVKPSQVTQATTSKPLFSTYKPFLNQFSSRSTPKQFSSSSSQFFTSSKLFINNDGQSNKVTVVKPRETKNEVPFTIKSLSLKNNETLYAFVSNPGYSFAISSRGFKFVRTAD